MSVRLLIMVGGSTAGMHRLLAGQAVACGLHLVDATTGEYDAAGLARSLQGLDFVVIEWARRQQGLVLAPGNPEKIGSIADLRRRGIRVATRQQGSGTALLMSKLLGDAGLAMDDLKTVGRPVWRVRTPTRAHSVRGEGRGCRDVGHSMRTPASCANSAPMRLRSVVAAISV